MAETTWGVFLNDWRRRRHGNKYDQTYADLYLKDDFGGRLKRCVELMDLKLEDRVYDIGCGNGLLGELVGPKVSLYAGVDVSKDMVEKADAKRIPNAVFLHCDGEPTYGEWKNFSVLTMMDLVEHIDDATLRAHLSAARQSVLNPMNGRLYIHTPNADYFMEKLKAWGALPQIAGHIAVRDKWELTELLEDAGFEVAEIKYLPHYTPLLRWTHWLSNLPLIGRFFRARLWIVATHS